MHKKNLISSLLFVAVFFCLYYIDNELVKVYLEIGDMRTYSRAYEDIAGEDFVSAYSIYNALTGALEPMPLIISYVFSRLGINFIFLNAFLNSLLIFLLINRLRESGFGWVIPFVVISFYLLILMYVFFRLKIGVIFFLLSMPAYYNNSKKVNSVAYFASIFSHFQMLLFFPLFFDLRRGKIIYISAILIIFYFSHEYIFGKISWYASENVIIPYKSIVFLILIYILSHKNFSFYIFMFFTVLAAILIGDQRINILLYFWVLSILNQVKSLGWRPLMCYALLIPVLVYQALKGIDYFNSLIEGVNYYDISLFFEADLVLPHTA